MKDEFKKNQASVELASGMHMPNFMGIPYPGTEIEIILHFKNDPLFSFAWILLLKTYSCIPSSLSQTLDKGAGWGVLYTRLTKNNILNSNST